MSPLDKIRTINSVIYALAIAVAYWRLIPRLSPAGRFLATLMLAAQALALFMALVVHPEDLSSIRGLWHLSREQNIPAVIATTQLAVVGLVAALTAWFTRTLSPWQRLYWLGIALLFLLLAREEYLDQRYGMAAWKYAYAAVGAVVVGSTAFFAVRSPPDLRIWHICLVAGLGLGALGGLGVDVLRSSDICIRLGFPIERRCMLFMVEEALEMLGIWLILVAVLGQLSVAAPSQRWGLRLTIIGLPAFVVGALLLSFPILRQRAGTLPLELEYLYRARPAAVEYEAEVDLRAYRVEVSEGAMAVTLVAMVTEWDAYSGWGYSIHLIDQATGKSIGGVDASASRRQSFKIGKHHLFIQRMNLEIPPGTAFNRALWVALSAWREENDAFVAQSISSSDVKLLDEKRVILEELALPPAAADAAPALLAGFDNGAELARVELPESARPGATLEIQMVWSAAKDITDDHIQFLHFGNDVSGEWWIYDQQPLGPRLPTRFWRSGFSDVEIWEIPLPDDLAPGQYNVFTGLYRASDQERAAARDTAGAFFADARVPLGVLIIEDA